MNRGSSRMISIFLLRVVDERCGIDLPAGTIVILIEDSFDHITFMTSNERIVKIWDVSLEEVMTDDPSNVDPTRELKIVVYGTKCWYKYGQLHRNDGPAIEYADGVKQWYKNGQFIREDSRCFD